MHRLIHRHILLPAFEGLFKGRRTFRYWRELERSQWLSTGELQEMQFQALRRLISHAFEHCRYYRETWSQVGLEPRQLGSIEDLKRWPIIDRQIILANRKEMRAAVPGMRLIAKSTGGSSGEPLHFDLDTDSNDRRVAASFRGYNWAGAAPGTKQFYLWGGALTALPKWKQLKEDLHHALYRRKMVSSFRLSEASVPGMLEELNRYRPDVIVAYTNPLYEFARFIKEKGLVPHKPRSIVVGAEKLHPFQRELIESVFGTPVFETYGSREFMLSGAECERHKGLHLTTEYQVVEVVDDEGQPAREGEEGNIVITDLYNYGMPFIRYANGDRAIAGWGKCSCGRGLPLLRSVVGRTLDVLGTPDGRRVPGEFFPHLMKDFPAVRRFQVVQDEPDHVQLRLVVGEGWGDAEESKIRRIVCSALGEQVRFDMVRVDEIPLTRAGKLRVVVNECGPAMGLSGEPTAASAGGGDAGSR